MALEPEFSALSESAKTNNHRHLVVLAGDQDWCIARLQPMLQHTAEPDTLWLGEHAPENIAAIPAGKAGQWLGQERKCLVFNGWSGFDVDAFGAISGTLCGGGILFLLMPPLAHWHSFPDPEQRRIQVYPEALSRVTGHYLSRLRQITLNSDSVSLLQQGQAERWAAIKTATVDLIEKQNRLYLYPCRTLGQQQAVAAVERVARGHRRRPLVLTADRGRGKSAALGIAAASLLQQALTRIVVTAPALACVETLFHHAVAVLDDAETGRGFIRWQGREICFRAPDELVQGTCECDLMLVDEAAALPVPLLEKLLQAQARIVFSSTIHGYEGTGRGFAIRFRQKLNNITPKWKPLHIRQAIRWADGDPLEQFVFKALLLDATPADSDNPKKIAPEKCEWVHFDRAVLARNEDLIRQVFGLLVLAHYRTRPFDLRHFLDGPNIDAHGLMHQGQLLGTVLTAREGELPELLHEPIWLGQRRVRGHLLPQSLSNHVGIPEAAALKGVRVLRIAVHPELRRQGLGKTMLNHLRNSLHKQGVDYLGTSFGATDELMQFWQHSGMVPVRVGLTREAASGCYPMMMLEGLSARGQGLQKEAGELFFNNLLVQLPDSLRQMDSALACRLLISSSPEIGNGLSARQQQDLLSYTKGQRLYESCQLSIRCWLLHVLGTGQEISKSLCFLVAKVLQQHDWQMLATSMGLPGKKQAQAELRQRVKEKASNKRV